MYLFAVFFFRFSFSFNFFRRFYFMSFDLNFEVTSKATLNNLNSKANFASHMWNISQYQIELYFRFIEQPVQLVEFTSSLNNVLMRMLTVFLKRVPVNQKKTFIVNKLFFQSIVNGWCTVIEAVIIFIVLTNMAILAAISLQVLLKYN